MRVFLLNTHTVTGDMLQKWAATLPPFRKAAAARCRRPLHYLQTVAGFCLVRYAVRQIAPDADTEQWHTGENGKPCLPAGTPHFSLSHTDHIIAVGVSDEVEIGVDIEEIKPRSKGFAARYCSVAECSRIVASHDPHSELIRIWSAKEAEAKRIGTGLTGDIRRIPSENSHSIPVECNGAAHWLSLSPRPLSHPVVWVNAAEL